MRKILLTSLGLFYSMLTNAGTMGEHLHDHWHAAIGTGYGWSLLPGINNPNPAEWDYAIQGYNAALGNRGFYTFEIGKQIQNNIDINLLYLNNEKFNYQIFQTGSSQTIGYSGNARTRYFNLVNRSLLVNAVLHPAQHWLSIHAFELLPFISGGIGYGYNQVSNFYTVGTVIVTNTAVGSVTSTGNQVSTNSFAWQASVGLNIQLSTSPLSVDVGYRFYDGGRFNTSNVLMSAQTGIGTVSPWSGTMQANQMFVDFKYTF
ncbi:MAG TPA: porin family protein [Legionellaceae bacterium]|nr:porin family protein [Legionellaceae bacterium]